MTQSQRCGSQRMFCAATVTDARLVLSGKPEGGKGCFVACDSLTVPYNVRDRNVEKERLPVEVCAPIFPKSTQPHSLIQILSISIHARSCIQLSKLRNTRAQKLKLCNRSNAAHESIAAVFETCHVPDSVLGGFPPRDEATASLEVPRT